MDENRERDESDKTVTFICSMGSSSSTLFLSNPPKKKKIDVLNVERVGAASEAMAVSLSNRSGR